MSYSNRELVEFYINYKLSQRDYHNCFLRPEDADGRTEGDKASSSALNGWPVNSTVSGQPWKSWPSRGGIEAVKSALKDSADEFELLFKQGFSDLSLQLDITPHTAYHSFKSVLDEVFKDGVNWGRIVGLFAFGGVLCVECAERNMSELVSRIADWMTIYLDEQISPWIHSQGGWDCFAEIYGRDAAADARRFQETLKKWLLVGVALITGVLLGVFIAKKR
ncbi:bcl-2-like protein 1 [Melanotaenia boesemani]|uniref:bcl-2-like protein 1 n=1 Tax=Melanotaenia boesemani TaxID=1250792 RepID=UPI001C05098E|nr:bcl-2-like protein 1 [Melanotaenia boesemani]XP_041836265.1 bcl-2-like protein 1 [Melanotaenia boesemani]